MRRLGLVVFLVALVSVANAEEAFDYNVNIVLPGWYQLQQGNPEAPWLLPSMPLIVAGTAIGLLPSDTTATIIPGLYASDTKVLGAFLSQIGSVGLSYSYYDALRDRLPSPGLTLATTLTAPFDPVIVGDPRVWGLVAIAAVASTTSQLKLWAKVRASGVDLEPLPVISAGKWALGLLAAVSAGYSEELTFRGVVVPTLQSKGWTSTGAVAVTALGFGLVLVTNMILTPPRTESEWITAWSQPLTAALTGLYLGWESLDGEDGLRRAIATHFWWNAIAMVSNQVVAVDSHHGDWSLMFGPTGVQVSTSY